MRDFRQLQVWQKSHALTLNVYQAAKDFPDLEKYGLTSQIRRSAQSIPTISPKDVGETERQNLHVF